MDLYNSGKFNAVSVDCGKTNQLLQLMDTVVVKLEGGTEEDLATLEQEYVGELFHENSFVRSHPQFILSFQHPIFAI